MWFLLWRHLSQESTFLHWKTAAPDGNRTSDVITRHIDTPHGAVFRPLLFTLLEHSEEVRYSDLWLILQYWTFVNENKRVFKASCKDNNPQNQRNICQFHVLADFQCYWLHSVECLTFHPLKVFGITVVPNFISAVNTFKSFYLPNESKC